MLKKLLKYEIKNTLKFLLIFYSISAFFAGLTRIFFIYEDSSTVVYFLGQLCQGIAISMMCSSLFNNIIRLWARFRQNFYGDESYITHTLPVTKGLLFAAKIISAVITMLITVLVIGVCLFIMYYSNGIGESIKSLLYPAADFYDTSAVTIILVLLLLIFLQFFNILQCGYTGIVLGHKLNKNKIGMSVLFGGAVYMASQTIVTLLMLTSCVIDERIFDLFTQLNPVIPPDVMKLLILSSIVSYLIVAIANYLISMRSFKKGVNVD